MRVPKRFFGILDFPYLKLGIQDFKAKRRTKFGFEIMRWMWVAKNTLTIGITGLNEILGRDYGNEELYWETSIIFVFKILLSYTQSEPISLSWRPP